ncbi:MAG TPA: protein translocase subunit SecF [Acidimicrobiia bacterium]
MSPRADGSRHTFSDLIHERTRFDFAGRPWRWLLLSGTAVLICLASLGFKGLNLGIDFEGGTSWQVEVEGKSPSVGDVRDDVLQPLGLADAKVQTLGGDSIRVQSEELPAAERREVTNALAAYAGVEPSEVSVSSVGPTWGSTVSEKALRALLIFFGIVALYLSIRFEWKIALAMILAMVHDIIITAGVYSLGGFEVTPATVVAFLTILGFSLYDSVVVFDKVRENSATLGTVRGDTYTAMVNRSMNQVLMRSLNTSFVALLPVVSLLVVGSGIMGAVALRDFALALFVGLVTGTYSSIFVAVPLVAWLKEREPRYRALRERAVAAGARPGVPAPEHARVGAASPPASEAAPDAVAEPASAPEAAESPPRGVPARPTGPARAPRPRQQRRRKRR